jgi:hypothetical protein
MRGGLAGRSAAEVLSAAGWLRSVGGCNPYLALRDRAGLGREAVDRAVEECAVHELPAARGCTYVVPAEDFALALRAGQGGGAVEMAMAKKYLGVTEKEIDALSRKALDAVAREPLAPAAIRDVIGDAARSLGAEGKKRGMTTTLPLSLGLLQAQGEIRRVPVDGRLDSQRYRYARWSPSPLANARLDDAQVAMELGRRFFRWSGPATVAQLAWWSGLGVTAARAAAAELGVVPAGEGSDRLLFPDDLEALRAFEVPREPVVSFVSALDNLFHPRREIAPHLDAKDAARAMPGDAKGRTLGALADLDYAPIVDRGRLIGLWDWDGLAGELVWMTFRAAPKGAREAAKEMAGYVTRDLGDVRSFSLDSPASRVARLAALRSASG